MLPSPCFSLGLLIDTFQTMGLRDPVFALVTLSGAHSIGKSRQTVWSTCSRGLGSFGHRFGSGYNEALLEGRGWFASDRALNWVSSGKSSLTDNQALSRIQALVTAYASNETLFFNSWCSAFQEMSLLGIDDSSLPDPHLVSPTSKAVSIRDSLSSLEYPASPSPTSDERPAPFAPPAPPPNKHGEWGYRKSPSPRPPQLHLPPYPPYSHPPPPYPPPSYPLLPTKP
jgi:hypothetical protein